MGSQRTASRPAGWLRESGSRLPQSRFTKNGVTAWPDCQSVPTSSATFTTMNFDQGEFNFEAPGSDAGWRRWRDELDEKRRAFEARWGVVLGKRVTVSLTDHAKPLTGMIEWLEPAKADRNAPPRFKLRGLEFGVGEIESIVQEQ